MFSTNNPSNDRINVVIQTPISIPQEISVKAYKGLVGKIMQIMGYAVFVNVNKDGTEVFVNKRSLAKQILINQGLKQEKITNKVKDKAIEVLLGKSSCLQKNTEFPLKVRETMKAVAELEIHKNEKDEGIYQKKLQKARLSELLSEPELDLVWSNKDKLPAISSKAAISEEILYNYINGVTDINGDIQDLAVSRDNLEYIEALRSIIDQNNPVKVSLQTPGLEKNISSSKSEQSKMIRPLDDYLKDSESNLRFQKLPKEYQEYIFASARENYAGISPEKKEVLMRKEHELRQVLQGDQLSEFKRCMQHANTQNAARSGFIHFRLQDAAKTTPFERIYIQMNKKHAEDLVRLLISELYKQGEYPGVLDIKVAGPQVAGRTDGIVIYIGEASQKVLNEPSMRQKAIKERDKVLKKLKEIQQQRPELFGNGVMPFKEIYTPGVAIISGLSTSESFTKDLSRAIVSALANSKDRQDFRNKIIEAFFASD